MEDLAKADFRTIKTFITNNITAERLLLDILQQSATQQSTDKKNQQDKKDTKIEEDVAVEAREKGQNCVNPANRSNTEPDDPIEDNLLGRKEITCVDPEDAEKVERRRKMKNQYKKRKRQEKKVIKDHESTIQRIWEDRLWHEYNKRCAPEIKAKNNINSLQKDCKQNQSIENLTDQLDSDTQKSPFTSEERATEFSLSKRPPNETLHFSRRTDKQ